MTFPVYFIVNDIRTHNLKFNLEGIPNMIPSASLKNAIKPLPFVIWYRVPESCKKNTRQHNIFGSTTEKLW